MPGKTAVRISKMQRYIYFVKEWTVSAEVLLKLRYYSLFEYAKQSACGEKCTSYLGSQDLWKSLPVNSHSLWER